MKLRISDAIDCTCTAGGWSRELNSAIREREGRGGEGWDGGGRCSPGQIQGKKTGWASEWMASNLFHPFVGAARAACANLPLFRLCVRFPLIPWSPLQILPSCTRLTPEHNGSPISFAPGLTFSCLNTDMYARVCTPARISSSWFSFRFPLRENVTCISLDTEILKSSSENWKRIPWKYNTVAIKLSRLSWLTPA